MKNQGKMYLEFKRRGCHSKIYLITYMEDSMWMQLILVAFLNTTTGGTFNFIDLST